MPFHATLIGRSISGPDSCLEGSHRLQVWETESDQGGTSGTITGQRDIRRAMRIGNVFQHLRLSFRGQIGHLYQLERVIWMRQWWR